MATGWRLTVRAGSKVERERYATLDEALAGARRRLDVLRDAAPKRPVSVLGRDYAPASQVAARLELGRRRPRGGIDVRGDGSIAAWVGLVRKRLLEVGDDPVAALGEALVTADRGSRGRRRTARGR